MNVLITVISLNSCFKYYIIIHFNFKKLSLNISLFSVYSILIYIINLKHKGIKRKGHSLYDPYLIQVCKNAIIKEKRQLPNYREIIRNINTEFGIEESEKNNFEKYNNSPNENKIKLTINIE